MEKITVAIIGLGNITHGYDRDIILKEKMLYPTHLSVLKKMPQFKLVAGCDPSGRARKLFAKKVNKDVKLFKDYREMINIVKPQLLVVASPTFTHVNICKDAVNLGVKQILCEKPVSYSAAKFRSLAKQLSAKRIKFAVNYFRLYNSTYESLIQQVHSEKFGSIKSVNVYYSKGVFNTATHVITLLEKMFGPIKSISKSKRVLGGIDPTLSFTASFKSFNANFIADKTNKSYFDLHLEFSKKKLRINRDASSDVAINIRRGLMDVYQRWSQAHLISGVSTALRAVTIAEATVKSQINKKTIVI